MSLGSVVGMDNILSCWSTQSVPSPCSHLQNSALKLCWTWNVYSFPLYNFCSEKVCSAACNYLLNSLEAPGNVCTSVFSCSVSYSCRISTRFGMYWRIYIRLTYITFHEKLFTRFLAVTSGQTGRYDETVVRISSWYSSLLVFSSLLFLSSFLSLFVLSYPSLPVWTFCLCFIYLCNSFPWVSYCWVAFSYRLLHQMSCDTSLQTRSVVLAFLASRFNCPRFVVVTKR